MTDAVRRWHVRTTLAVLLLSAVASLLGLFWPPFYRGAPAQVDLYRLGDASMLLVGLPVLAVGLWTARRGSLRGRIVWLGGLAYTTYTWASVGLQVGFNAFFLGYVALFALSLFTLVAALTSTDPDEVRAALDGRLSERLYGVSLLAIGLGLSALWLSDIVPATLAGTAPTIVEETGPQALVSHFVDLAVVVPSLFVAGVFLFQKRPWGYVFAGVTLVLGSLLAVTIAAQTLAILTGDVISVSTVALVGTFLPVLLAAVFAVRFVFSIADGGGVATGD